MTKIRITKKQIAREYLYLLLSITIFSLTIGVFYLADLTNENLNRLHYELEATPIAQVVNYEILQLVYDEQSDKL